MHLVVVLGPPAVGKMTVGRAICARTDFRLFHNHMTVEPLLGVFELGTPPFVRLTAEIRQRVIEEAVRSGMPGLVHTMVWGLELEEDVELVRSSETLVMNTRPGARTVAEDPLEQHPWLRIDNTDLSPDEVADRVVASWV